jgi:hypothetical protein
MLSLKCVHGVCLFQEELVPYISRNFPELKALEIYNFEKRIYCGYIDEGYVMSGHSLYCECGCQDMTEKVRRDRMWEKNEQEWAKEEFKLNKFHGPLGHGLSVFFRDDDTVIIGVATTINLPDIDTCKGGTHDFQKYHDAGYYMHTPMIVEEDKICEIRNGAIQTYVRRDTLPDIHMSEEARELIGWPISNHLFLEHEYSM